MTTSPLMGLGVKAMAANMAALQTTGHNISNANVKGYSRQSVGLETSPGQYTGAGFMGRGVDVGSITRAHDAFLTREAGSARSLAAMDSARLQQLESLEKVFQTGEGSIGDAISQLFGAVSDLTSHPADLSTRQVVLGRARDVAAVFSASGQALQTLQSSVTFSLKAAVTEVNTLARGVAEINQRIAAAVGSGLEPNDLLDQREAMISQLAEQVQVTRIDMSDGSVSLFVGGGQTLVLGTQANGLRVVQDASDPLDTTRSMVELVTGGTLAADGQVTGGQGRTLPADYFGGGTVKGLLDFQYQDLATARTRLDGLAVALRDAFNEQQQAGFDLTGNFGQPLFDPVAGTAEMSVLITDPRGIAAASLATATDNGNALAMLALRDQVRPGLNESFNDTWIDIAADVGVRTQSAATSSEMSAAVSERAEQARSSQAGVNLDEEAARLIQFQQSYQAAAKVLQVAQNLFDTLLQAASA